VKLFPFVYPEKMFVCGGVEMNLLNCPKCGKLFVQNAGQELCRECFLEEEEAFQKVNNFLRDRKNRMATMMDIIENTGVSQDLIIKFIRKGRIQVIHFPNLAYPCSRCGKLIRKGNLCEDCINELRNDLEVFEKERERQEKLHLNTYYINRGPENMKK
jgi:flagellar operon protein (TIGR03826 family)